MATELRVTFVGDDRRPGAIVGPQGGRSCSRCGLDGLLSSCARGRRLGPEDGRRAAGEDDDDDEDEVLDEQKYVQALGADSAAGNEELGRRDGCRCLQLPKVKRSQAMPSEVSHTPPGHANKLGPAQTSRFWWLSRPGLSPKSSELARPGKSVTFNAAADTEPTTPVRSGRSGKVQFVSTTPTGSEKNDRDRSCLLRQEAEAEEEEEEVGGERVRTTQNRQSGCFAASKAKQAARVYKTPPRRAEPRGRRTAQSDRGVFRSPQQHKDKPPVTRRDPADPHQTSEAPLASGCSSYSEWAGLQCGVYGVWAAKKALWRPYRLSQLSQELHLVVNGFFPQSRSNPGTFRKPSDQIEYISQTLKDSPDLHIYLLIHNIGRAHAPRREDPECFGAPSVPPQHAPGGIHRPHQRSTGVTEFFLRGLNVTWFNVQSLNTLSHYTILPVPSNIIIIISPVWDQCKQSQFNWLWWECVTYQRYVEETSYENSLLVQQTGALALSSLTHVLRSLTSNARGIFKLLVEFQLENRDNPSYTGLSFQDFYQRCREAFLVNSDLTLRTQLTEFRDHKLIRTRKGADGVEYLLVPVETSTLLDFVEERG
ncbi:Origin recognition complex subunit 2 [Merluccius polli]|uniref:Origin recognition complex subunit 2 n=1 Tax=Merluccius polli TaxID=89951 RepID=A0AA47P8N8_MERPO|nr:Origin recognition complex subunit 2 [Merluccius polli]